MPSRPAAGGSRRPARASHCRDLAALDTALCVGGCRTPRRSQCGPANRPSNFLEGRAMATCFSATARRATWIVLLASAAFSVSCGRKEEPAGQPLRWTHRAWSPATASTKGGHRHRRRFRERVDRNPGERARVGGREERNGPLLQRNQHLRRSRQSDRAPVHRKHDALRLGLRDGERRGRWPDHRQVGRRFGLAAEVHPRHRSADLRRRHHRRQRQPRPALQPNGPGAEHLVPRRGRVQRRDPDAGHLRQRRPGQRRAGRDRPHGDSQQPGEREHRAAHGWLQHPRHPRRRADLRAGPRRDRDPG